MQHRPFPIDNHTLVDQGGAWLWRLLPTEPLQLIGERRFKPLESTLHSDHVVDLPDNSSIANTAWKAHQEFTVNVNSR